MWDIHNRPSDYGLFIGRYMYNIQGWNKKLILEGASVVGSTYVVMGSLLDQQWAQCKALVGLRGPGGETLDSRDIVG